MIYQTTNADRFVNHSRTACRFLRLVWSGLALSPDGNHMLSNSMDNSVMMWDVRPFANQNRLEKTFHGIKVTTQATLIHDGCRSR